MKSSIIYPISFLIISTFFIEGCSSIQKIEKKTEIHKVEKQTASPIKIPQKMGINLSELKQNGSISSITLRAKKSYALNESVQFVVNTGEAEGFLYIIYLSNKGETGLLYPNANAPLSEMAGSFLFPNDFGNMNIRATKDCKGCASEKTSIYALLSKEPILDIKNITQNDLLNFTSSTDKSRSLSLELNNNSKTTSNLYVGRVDFFVE